MPRYEFDCDRCTTRTPRFTMSEQRDAQRCDACGGPLTRISAVASIVIGIPAGFKTMFSDVHGIPGSPQREQFEKDVKSGEVQYAGRGSRWV